MDITAKLQTAMENPVFAEALLCAETEEQAQSLFASAGIDLTLEEVKAIGAGLKAQLSGDELDETALDAVSGGSVLGTVATVVGIIAGCVKIVDFVGKRAGWWK